MKTVYRVKTIYHLLQVLIILDNKNKNILYLDDEKLFYLKDKINNSNLFSTVKLNKCLFIKNKVMRYVLTICNALVYSVLKYFVHKDMILVTAQHNVCGKLLHDYVRAQRIIILEEGNYSYQYIVNGQVNSLYSVSKSKNFLKFIFSSYFITIKRNHNDKFIYFDKEKLQRELPTVFYKLENRIIEVDMNERLMSMSKSKKNQIQKIFSIEDLRIDNSKIKMIILTQPIVEAGILSLTEYVKLIKQELNKYDREKYQIFLKEHPREKHDKYKDFIDEYSLIVLDKTFPFEILKFLNLNFEVGITYNSTAIWSKLIQNKILLDANYNEGKNEKN